MRIVSWLVLGGVATFMFFSAQGVETGAPGAEVKESFRRLIADPVPPDVSELQGSGTSGPGYSIALRFRAPSLRAAGITHPGYERVACVETYRTLMGAAPEPSPFDPPWQIPVAEDSICLEWRELENTWTERGTHTVLHADGFVYFFGRGQ